MRHLPRYTFNPIKEDDSYSLPKEALRSFASPGLPYPASRFGDKALEKALRRLLPIVAVVLVAVDSVRLGEL